jgi:hypothetical protein
MTVSRQRFSKWVVAYSVFKTGLVPEEGRDMVGKWMIIREQITE